MSRSKLQTFFQEIPLTDGVSFKNSILKKKILAHFANEGNATLADLGHVLKLSTPKINELVIELIEMGLVKDYGKVNSGVGRKPHIYGLESESVFFVRSEEHTSELQSRENLVCRLLLEKKKNKKK